MPPKTEWRTYQDFVITIKCADQGRYRVEAHGPTGEATTTFALPFDDKDIEILLLKVGHPRRMMTRGRVPAPVQPSVEFGTKLFNAIINGQVRDIFVSARHDAERSGYGLRLQLRLSDVLELADLPWEFLYDGRDFLALSEATPVVRYLDLPNPPRAMRVPPPLRVLVTISAPHDQPRLDVETEKAKVQEALASLEERGMVELGFTVDGTLSTLRRTMRRARSLGRSYHVWHFIGHGAFDPVSSASVLAFCDRAARSYLVGGFQLGTLFSSFPQMRLVLLNACDGARPDPQDPFAGVAAALVERGVPAVIGMQWEISDEAANAFGEEFYQALADGLPVDAALTEARQAIFFLPNWIEWATPVLFMRSPDGQLFEIPAAVRPVERRPKAVKPGEEARPERLASLYTEALDAFFTEQWAMAIELLSEIVSLDPSYQDAASKLEEAKRERKLAELYAEGNQAYDAQSWAKAVGCLEAICAIDAGYRDAVDRLEEAKRQNTLATLYGNARQLYQAQKWQAVVNVFERIKAIDPDYPDPERLWASSWDALAVQDQEKRLAALYSQALQLMNAEEWSAALRRFEEIQHRKPGYRQTDALLSRALEEVRKLEPAPEPGVEAVQLIETSELVISTAKLTDVGRAKPHNQDYVDYYVPPDPQQAARKGFLYVVADGGVGQRAGEIASQAAVELTIGHYYSDTSHDWATSLVRAFRAANQQIYEQAQADPAKSGMGTTLVAAMVLGKKVYVANVGNSRAYLINKRGIVQITEDHSWVEEQVRAGLLRPEQARRHPQRNLVTRALGSKPAVEVDLFEGEINAGDTLLLCSDGLTGRVSDQEIAATVREHLPAEAARLLVGQANERGGNDNITVLIVDTREEAPASRKGFLGFLRGGD